MSCQWYFHSFSIDAFRQICGSATKRQEDALVKAVTQEEEGGFDEDEFEAAEHLAREIANKGLVYHEGNRKEWNSIDTIVTTMFSSFGLERELKMKAESPDAMNPRLIVELVNCGKNIVDLMILRWLIGGRRFGRNDEECNCDYCIFLPNEVQVLKKEVELLMTAKSIKWSYAEIPSVTEAVLLNVLRKASTDNTRGLFAKLT